MVLQAMLLSKVLTLARYLHTITLSLLTIGKIRGRINSPTYNNEKKH